MRSRIACCLSAIGLLLGACSGDQVTPSPTRAETVSDEPSPTQTPGAAEDVPADGVTVGGVTYAFDNGCGVPGPAEEMAYSLTVRDGDVYADLDVTTQDVPTPDATTTQVVEVVFRRTPDSPDQRAEDMSGLTVADGHLIGDAELISDDDGSSVPMAISLELPTTVCD